MRSNASQPVVEVVVVDPDALVRRGMVGALSGQRDIRVTGEAATGREALTLVLELAPTALIVDPQLPDGDGIQLVRTIHLEAPAVAILLLAGDESEEFALHALREGASGVLSRNVPLEALPRIVRSLAAGEAVITRALGMRLVELMRRQPAAGSGLRPVHSQLSTREWEVLDLICAGAGTRDIAEQLGLSPETVRSHVKRLLRKLGAHSRAEAATIATRVLADCAPMGFSPAAPRG